MLGWGRTRVMGILNVTPDSFSDGGRFIDPDVALAHARRMLADGADIIDVGGESTRPGAAAVSEDEEIRRTVPVIERIVAETGALVSIDTMKPGVARAALSAGARMVNDMNGLRAPGMIEAVSAAGAWVVIAHMRGVPGDMQRNPLYGDLIGEISAFLAQRAAAAAAGGIAGDKIIVDPGIGFGKTLEDNYRIINTLNTIGGGYPVLIGLSRKSLIGGLVGPEDSRLPGTLALNTVAVLNGAAIIRVHDVREHVLALKCIEMLKKVG
jgi:dihydropteroate synthase